MGRTLNAPKAKLLSALVRAGDARAIKRVVAALKRNDGNMEATAIELEVASRTLYLWRDSVPGLGDQMREHARGRIGRPKNRTTNEVEK
jgi:hypothetical protein